MFSIFYVALFAFWTVWTAAWAGWAYEMRMICRGWQRRLVEAKRIVWQSIAPCARRLRNIHRLGRARADGGPLLAIADGDPDPPPVLQFAAPPAVPVLDDAPPVPLDCGHSRVTRRGSNKTWSRVSCYHCGHLLYRYRRDNVDPGYPVVLVAQNNMNQ